MEWAGNKAGKGNKGREWRTGVKRTRWIAARHKLLGVWGLLLISSFFNGAANTCFAFCYFLLLFLIWILGRGGGVCFDEGGWGV